MEPRERIAEIQAQKQELSGEAREKIEAELSLLLVKIATTPYERIP